MDGEIGMMMHATLHYFFFLGNPCCTVKSLNKKNKCFEFSFGPFPRFKFSLSKLRGRDVKKFRLSIKGHDLLEQPYEHFRSNDLQMTFVKLIS